MSYTVVARDDPAVRSIPNDRDRRAVIALHDLLQTHLSEYHE